MDYKGERYEHTKSRFHEFRLFSNSTENFFEIFPIFI